MHIILIKGGIISAASLDSLTAAAFDLEEGLHDNHNMLTVQRF